MADDDPRDFKQVSLRLSAELVRRIDVLKAELGCRSRGAVLEQLLHHLLGPEGEEVDAYGFPSLAPQQLELGADALPTPAHSGSQAAVDPAVLEPSQPGVGGVSAVTAEHPSREGDAPGLSQPLSAEAVSPSPSPEQSGDFDECGALVLLAGNRPGELLVDPLSGLSRRDQPVTDEGGGPESSGHGSRQAKRGIDLPGFVQRRSDQLRRSLDPQAKEPPTRLEPMPQVPAERLSLALSRADQHWHELYAQPAQAPVLEAAMLWIAQDIWPQSDQSEGRLFTWSLGREVMRLVAPSWPEGPASFAKVMVMAGVLEDPFSSATLELRIPTLIRRFVHRFRQRRSGTSFQSLEHTMTLLGALKLLQLPTDPGERLTLPQIREAYREMALAHHPDAGGSDDLMRRLNEAYQLLKELYRTR